MVEKLYIDNENFIKAMKAMFTEGFGKPQFVVIWDKLSKENKAIMEDREDIPKTNLTIITKDAKSVPKKFKHQIEIQKQAKDDIFAALKMTFKAGSREEVIKELNKFESRHILTILESTSMYYPQLAEKLSKFDRFVYDENFRDIIAYELENMNCLPRWSKR